MTFNVPNHIKIFHIIHIDRLASVIQDGCLLSDAIISQRNNHGSMIGFSHIKQRRLTKLYLNNSHPNLTVGQCVPFYFCPRSVMLYLIHRRNSDLTYQGGQQPIIHLQADFNQVIQWADDHDRKWAFTRSNAGSYYFENFNQIQDLNKIDWYAVNTNDWQACREYKQAEFLLEEQFPWYLIEKIGVYSDNISLQVKNIIQSCKHQPIVEVMPHWYY